MIRHFESGATRDTSKGKFDYRGFRNPMCEHSFAGYMHAHRFLPDGSIRDSDNWWGGFGKQVALESLVRHVVDLEALNAGYRVFKERSGEEEHTHYLYPSETPAEMWRAVNEEECCNAIRFGSQAYLLEVLKKR